MAIVRGNVQTLVSGIQTASSTTSSVLTIACPDAATFLLNVTTSVGATTLDVYLQTSPNTGTTWYDFAHFTQVGATTQSIQALQWSRKAMDATNATSVIATGDGALAAAKVINGPIVDSYFRTKWVISGTSYTFSVFMIADRDV